MNLSVVVPTLNEARALPQCLHAVRRELPGAEIVVADGGSTDGTLDLAGAAVVVDAPRGRGPQCRAGSEAARGDWILFLHADCVLQPGAGAKIREAIESNVVDAATLRLDYRRPELALRVTSWLSGFDTAWTSFGDQGILVRRHLHDRVGGMPAMPLFEDVRYLGRLRERARIHKLRASVVASTRRYASRGMKRQLAFNLGLMALYHLGVAPVRLARAYRAARKSPRWIDRNRFDPHIPRGRVEVRPNSGRTSVGRPDLRAVARDRVVARPPRVSGTRSPSEIR